MRQPAHGCNARAKRQTVDTLATDQFASITDYRLQPCCSLFSLPTGLTGWRSQRLTCGKRVPFALLTRADQGGTHPGLAGACQIYRRKRFARGVHEHGSERGRIRRAPGHLFPCFSRHSVCSACICERTNSPRGTTLAYARAEMAHYLDLQAADWFSKGEIHILRDEASL
jgi:hypothetical protein